MVNEAECFSGTEHDSNIGVVTVCTRRYGALLQASLVELPAVADSSPIFCGEIDGEVEGYIVFDGVLVGEVLKIEVSKLLAA